MPIAASMAMEPPKVGSVQIQTDPSPLKWSDLRYVFDIKENCNSKEALQARRDRREAALGGCSGLAGPGHNGGDPADRCERGDLLSFNEICGPILQDTDLHVRNEHAISRQ
jgi:hypothetical protein